MRRDVLRFSVTVGVVLLLALLLISGCTRSKSEGPPEATAEEAGELTSTPGEGTEPAPLSADEALNLTTTALAAEGTATAEAGVGEPQATEVEPTATPVPAETEQATAPPEPTEPQQEPATATPAGPEASAEPEATEAPSTEVKTHTVQVGENLFRIALKYGLSYQELAAYNGIANPHFISVGQVLKIPAGGEEVTPPSGEAGTGYHVVQAGENLFRIALKYGMSYTRLAAANGLSYPYTIYVGQRLTIP